MPGPLDCKEPRNVGNRELGAEGSKGGGGISGTVVRLKGSRNSKDRKLHVKVIGHMAKGFAWLKRSENKGRVSIDREVDVLASKVSDIHLPKFIGYLSPRVASLSGRWGAKWGTSKTGADNESSLFLWSTIEMSERTSGQMVLRMGQLGRGLGIRGKQGVQCSVG